MKPNIGVGSCCRLTQATENGLVAYIKYCLLRKSSKKADIINRGYDFTKY